MSTSAVTWSPTDGASSSLEVHLLGSVDFDSALFLQERLAYEISGRSDTLGGLLLCEHPPLVTIGREGSSSHLPNERRELTARNLDVRWLNRGGGCLVHAPGQLAVYPIVPLDRLGLGLVDYRTRLEEAVLDVCRELKISAQRHEQEPGVRCRSGQVAFVGIAAKAWVAYHGLFVNVCPNLDLLRLVRSNAEGRISSLAAEQRRSASMPTVRESLIRNLSARLNYDNHHIYTGHPLLHRTRKRVSVYAG
jgi:lipoyl(octanoyl) transferase